MIVALPKSDCGALLPKLRAKRTAVGAVESKPHRCPHIATTANIFVYSTHNMHSRCPQITVITILEICTLPADYHDYFIRNLHDALFGHCGRGSCLLSARCY
ncbi:hypothetical protein ACFX15_038132 [Malus domestica]